MSLRQSPQTGGERSEVGTCGRPQVRCRKQYLDVLKPCLHLDADASIKALHQALLRRGHRVTRTPTEWLAFDASDEEQLLKATARGCAIFTFNIRDFLVLAERYPEHHGIILAAQRSWSLSALIGALDHLLRYTEAEDLVGQVRWLNAWRV